MAKRALILIILLLSSAGLLLANNESERPAASDDSTALSGVWIWVKDSDGQTPVKGAVVALLFNAQGTVDFSAFKPGEEIEDHGRWSAAGQTRDGGLISLKLAEMGIKVEGKPYRLSGDVLILPLHDRQPGAGHFRMA